MTIARKLTTRTGFHLAVPAILGVVGSALLGCDVAGEENLGRLPGSWEVKELTVDGTSVTARLNARYDRLVLTLRRGGDGREFFSVTGRREGEDGILTTQGTFDKDGSELTLTPDADSLAQSVEVEYSISGEVDPVLTLRATEGQSEDALLSLIHIPIQGAVDQVQMRLSKS